MSFPNRGQGMTNKLTVNANSKMIIESQVMEKCDFSIGEGKKVLGITAIACVTGCEALNNELRVAVRTIFRIMYTYETKLECAEMKVDNVHSLYKEGITASTRAVIKANVIDCEHTSGNIVKGKATIEISGWYLVENKMDFLDTCQKDIFCKSNTVKVDNVNLLKASSLSTTNTFEARMPLSKILDSKASASINNVYVMNGSYQIEGEINVRVVALTDNNQFISQTFSHPFNTEISEIALTLASIMDVEVNVSEYVLSLTDTDSRTIICDLTMNFGAAENTSCEVLGITDAYSVSNDIVTTSTCFRLNTNHCYRSIRDKASMNVSIEGGANEVCCVLTPMVSASINTSRGNVMVEGLITTTLIYTDENSSFASMLVELPYQTTVAKDYECDAHLKPCVQISNINVRLRTSKEVEVVAELLITVRGISSKDICLISDMEIGEIKEENDYAISLYIVKPNQTIWDVAKALNTDENTILQLNSDLKLPLKGGERVLIYKAININF